jgi:hypothetical protein
MAFETAPQNVNRWIIDSGPTLHMTFDKSAFHSYDEKPEDWQITLGDNRIAKLQGMVISKSVYQLMVLKPLQPFSMSSIF